MDIDAEIMKLSTNAQTFLKEYFSNGQSSINAARAVAKSDKTPRKDPSTYAWNILNQAEVKPIVKAFQYQQLESMHYSFEKHLSGLVRIATTPITEFVTTKGNRITVNDMNDIPKEYHSCIKKLSRVETPAGARIDIEMHDPLRAYEQLARIMGINKDKTEVNANLQIGGVLRVPSTQTAEEWEAEPSK